MVLFVQKPIFWNTRDYRQPSGALGTGGYPKLHGYGHEEWNNAAGMQVMRDGRPWRVFHSGTLGAAPLQRHAGRIFMFLTVSHDGIQQLVGIVGQALALHGEAHRPQREAIVGELALQRLWRQAWAVPAVRARHRDDPRLFLRRWKADLSRMPNWLCPSELFWWLDVPVTLDPAAITGKRRLMSMFSSYTELDETMAGRMLDAIPAAQRDARWSRMVEAIHTLASDSRQHDDPEQGSERVPARRGQNRYRENLMRIWGSACAVTGVACREVLRASHVKPWAQSTQRQRLDSYNGLLLSANLDALFDRGLITFEDSGEMRISARLDAEHRHALGLPRPLRFMPKELLAYLRYHQEHVFRH